MLLSKLLETMKYIIQIINVLILIKKSCLELFNFVPHGQVAIQTGSQLVWCSRFLKRPLFIKDVMVKEQAMLIEEDISGHDQKMFPNVEQANDKMQKWIPKENSNKITEQVMKLYYYSLMEHYGKIFTYFP